MAEYTTKTVRLFDVSREDGQEAMDRMEEIFDAYEVPDKTRHMLWELHCILASDVLIRFGEFSPEQGHSERNGHA